MSTINVDEKLLRALIASNEALRDDLAKARDESAALGTAIQKAFEHPVQSDGGRNRLTNEIINAGILRPRDVKKQRATEADKRQQTKDKLREAKGLRKSRYDS